jgi:undecaprenyl-diphosphatase
MTIFESISLAIVQGITEFLPISSSGHLNLFQHFLGLTPSLTFDIFLNTATLLSVLFFFRSKLKFFFSNLPQIIIGSVPAGLVGVLFKHQIESVFSDVALLPLFFMITAAFVFSTQYFKNKGTKISYKQAIIIGLFQMVAILPGVSRSGSTIFAALLMGLSPVTAFNYSFSLFIPASFGALALGLKDIIGQNILQPEYLLAFVVTFLVGLLALSVLKKLLISNKLWYFGVYSLLLAIVLLFVFIPNLG